MAELIQKSLSKKTVKDSELNEFLQEVKKRFYYSSSYESTLRAKMIEDLKFKSGDQWYDKIKSDRRAKDRPVLTINKLKTLIHQVTNDQRQNRPSINIHPAGDGHLKTAELLRGMIRQIEQRTNAEVAYDVAFESAVSIGLGYFRISREYANDDTFDQELRIDAIHNPLSVYIDPISHYPDGSDMQWCFISETVPTDDFKMRYPKAKIMNWDAAGTGDLKNSGWITDKSIRVVEYFCSETELKELVMLENGFCGFKDDIEPSLLKKYKITDSRKSECRKVIQRTMTAFEILEESEWPGAYIPIVKVIGDEVLIDGKIDYSGIIRDAKDPQRMYNYQASSEAELIGLAPKAAYIISEGQIEGYEDIWAKSNVENYAALVYNDSAGKGSPPPQRTAFAGAPQGVIEAKKAAENDLRTVTGINFTMSQGDRMHDESGKALDRLRGTLELGSFHYIDNLARSLRHAGKILIDLIPKIYDTNRMMTIINEDGSRENILINPSQGAGVENIPPERGLSYSKSFNPRFGHYDVAVTIGPSYATKRQETMESIIMAISWGRLP